MTGMRYSPAEVPRLPRHCLGHASCTELAEAGSGIHTMKEPMGHRSIQTTLRCVHVGDDARAEAIVEAYGGREAEMGPRGNRKAKTHSNHLG